MTFIAVDGTGDPNKEDGAYKRAMELLYALCYTVKMSKLGGNTPEGYFDYVVPPLEGLWQMANGMPGGRLLEQSRLLLDGDDPSASLCHARGV